MSKKKETQPPVAIVEQHHKHVAEIAADHARRHLFLYGDVDETMAYRVAVSLAVMDGSDGDITVNLSTYGGSVEDGLAIYDQLRMAKNRVVVVGYGPVMSMGSIILQAGETRLLAPEARLLIHDGSWGTYSTMLKFAALGREAEATVGRMAKILSDRSNLTVKQVKKLMSQETFLSAEEAVKFGFADHVVMDPKMAVKMEKKKR